VHLVVEVVEGGVRQPGLVEEQGGDVAVQGGLDRLGVVDDPVIGALGQGEQPRGRGLVPDKRDGLDLGADAVRVELAARDWADDVGLVAGGRQENRDRAGQDQGVQHRLVAVAVDHDVPLVTK
jgi:hypothetical protein